jgi:hypothetical protein
LLEWLDAGNLRYSAPLRTEICYVLHLDVVI